MMMDGVSDMGILSDAIDEFLDEDEYTALKQQELAAKRERQRIMGDAIMGYMGTSTAFAVAEHAGKSNARESRLNEIMRERRDKTDTSFDAVMKRAAALEARYEKERDAQRGRASEQSRSATMSVVPQKQPSRIVKSESPDFEF